MTVTFRTEIYHHQNEMVIWETVYHNVKRSTHLFVSYQHPPIRKSKRAELRVVIEVSCISEKGEINCCHWLMSDISLGHIFIMKINAIAKQVEGERWIDY